MDVDRLSTGEKIAGVSAILLFIFMFIDWFSVDVGHGLYSATGGNAWDWLDVIPTILLIAIVAAVGVAVVRLTDVDADEERGAVDAHQTARPMASPAATATSPTTTDPPRLAIAVPYDPLSTSPHDSSM